MVRVLTEAEWSVRRREHEVEVDLLTKDHRARRRTGRRHPVEDFLFEYYSLRPALLRRWHPGQDVVLGGPSAREYLRFPHYVDTVDGVRVDVAGVLAKRGESIRWAADLLRATAGRPGYFGCFGMHEWAMVYRRSAEEIRHQDWPLRLGAEGTAAVVEERGIRCGHFDAFRFFTEAAEPLNTLRPTRTTQIDHEQPGCLHANMDLYKWAYKLSPLICSELLLSCFVLAKEIRELDMRASPYDLSELGYPPVRVETREGRAEYALAQRRFAERAAPLRARLLAECESALRTAASG